MTVSAKDPVPLNGEFLEALATVDRPPGSDTQVATTTFTAPASFAQQRLWLINELNPAGRGYNLRTAYAIQGNLDLPALKRSLAAIVRRHEVLRTTFELVDGELMQIVAPAGDLPISEVDVSDSPASARDAHIRERARAEGSRAFDLRCGPLMRAVVFRRGPYDQVLLLLMHHIVFDDGSVPVFNRELATHYAAYHRDMPPELAELPIQYSDFAAWQRDSTQAGHLAAQAAYWRTQLAGVPPRIELPLDRPRPAMQRLEGAVESIVLSVPLSKGIRALGRAHGATLFMTLLAAFNVLLYRYTGQRDLVVGSPITNRSRSELEPLIGFFVNTVALRTRLAGGAAFRNILRDVRETAVSTYDNADVPFERVVADLQPERSLSGTSIVNVMFFVRADLGDPLEIDDLRVEPFPLASTSSRFDLSLRVSERDAGLVCSLQYDTDLFESAKMRQLLRHFRTLIESIVAAPDAPIATLPMLSEAECERQVVAWNATTTPFAGDHTLAELFELQVERTPDAVALCADDAQLTYRELNAAANRLAGELRANGVLPGETVGIGTDRSIAMVVCTLAVVKVGGTYLPLDTDYPVERLSYMLRDAGVRIVLTRQRRLPAISDVCDVRILDAQAPTIREHNPDNVRSAISPDDIVCVIYTSGSTGRPKGVLVSGRAVSRLVTGTDYVRVAPTDVVAQVSNFSFDASIFELWAALLNGARLAIIAREVTLSPSTFAAALVARRVSVMFLTAALFRHVAGVLPSAFAGLRCLLVGGEKLDPAAARAVLEAGPPAQLLNAYGPTEATVFACTYEVSLPVPTLVPIGRPIANTEAYILDADDNLLPPGVAGQLHIGGPGLARGYLNDLESTARKFIDHPFSEVAGARLFATGDVARYQPDGTIEFLGRVDRQVKVRGFRIELDEIETALRGLPAVRDAVVDLRESGPEDRRLVAYVIDESRPERNNRAWRRLLEERLPSYMLPNVVVSVPVFPLTANGKIDLAALPDPRLHADEAPDDPLGDPRHDRLIGLWRRLLRTAEVGQHDNFFDLGGDSLLATRMIAEVGKLFGRVPLAAFLTNPTINHLATLLTADQATGDVESPIVEMRSTGERAPFFFFHGDLSDGGAYTHKLVRRFAADQPFYVLSPHGLHGTRLPATIEETASEYLTVIRSTRPDGPYVLGGFCSGGLVAFEIARRLQAENITVSNVILIDALGTHARFAALLDVADCALTMGDQRRIALYGRVFRSAAKVAEWVRFSAQKESGPRLFGVLGMRLFDLFVRAFGKHFTRRKQKAPQPEEPGSALALYRAWNRITASYVPRRYRGRVTLLLPEQVCMHRSTWIAGWKAVAQRLDVGIVPGDHLSCLTHFGDDLGAQLAKYLDQN